jgi:hypothetical protein
MQKQDIKNLKFRYLLWLYKTTKEELDRIERKFTQLDIDRGILGYISKYADSSKVKAKDKLSKFIKAFKEYIDNKEKDGLDLKFDNRKLKSEYYFSLVKLKAIEKSIVKQLGRKAKERIKLLYEQEMIRRILESEEHR